MPHRLLPDAAEGGRITHFNAAHSIGLPGMQCPSCGSWAVTGAQYPLIDARAVQSIVGDDRRSPVTLAEFANLTSVLRPLVGDGVRLLPGAAFGPIKGSTKGRFAHFAWLNPWTILLQSTAFAMLRDEGVPVQGRPAILTYDPADQDPLVELSALPRLHLASHLTCAPCGFCGRFRMKVPDALAITAGSYDPRVPLARIIELPTVLVASDAFVDAIDRGRLTGTTRTVVEVVPD